MKKIIGIDLGTTNSRVAVMEDGKLTVIANQEGARTTPSVVAVTRTGGRLVGEPAKRQAVTDAEKTISSVKRHMGTDYKKVIDDKQYSPQQISAMILQKLKADAEAYLGEKVTEAVITVPAHFNDAERQATKDAAKIAGLDVKRIISEPAAAALVYGFLNKKEQKIMVYDLGGGTFDVSIIEIGDGVIEVLSTNGDTHLGGDDFDNRIIQWLVDEFKKEEGFDLSKDCMTVERLRVEAEKAKKELSVATTTNICLPFIADIAGVPKHLDVTLTRVKFNELTHDLVERTAFLVQNAIKDADLTNAELDQVLLIGGSACIPAVQDKVRQLTGKEPEKLLYADECAALGACIQGGKMAGDTGAKEILLLEVTPLSLSVETQDGITTEVVERNTSIPIRKGEIFSIPADNQTTVNINVVQGEGKFAKDSISLGQFRLDGIQPTSCGVSQIEVRFDIDTDGIINVSAKDLETGKEHHLLKNYMYTDFGAKYNTVEKNPEENAKTNRQESKPEENLKAADIELTDQVKRQMAEFENFRKRTEKEKTWMFDMGAKTVIEKILPIVDNFERGFTTVEEADKEDAFVLGMDKVYKQLMTELEAIGVKPIEAVGQEFNPDFHNAVMQVASEEYESGVVAQELLKGYMYKDSVVRHSMVAVVE